MNKKRIILIAVLSAVLIISLSVLLSIRSRINRTEAVLGPASSEISGLRKIRLALACANYLEQFSKPVSPGQGNFILEIDQGEGVMSVLSKIAEGMNTDTEAMRLYWIYSGADRLINPGRFALNGTMTIPQITDLVTAAGESLVRFSFFSGMRLEEIAELIDSYEFTFSGSDFLSLASNYPAELHPAGETSLEGYFVPGNYEMSRGISLEDFLGNFAGVFKRRVQAPYEEAFIANGLTLHQAVILSSMIAREAMSASEYTTIASVFYNRLAVGMKLESDPTAQYGIGWDPGSRSWWKMPLTATDVTVNSVYNTYIIPGLPPGPICNPDAAIYEAVAYPVHTDYYYFRARCDNTPYHNFSRTYEEHVAYGCN